MVAMVVVEVEVESMVKLLVKLLPKVKDVGLTRLEMIGAIGVPMIDPGCERNMYLKRMCIIIC